MMKNPLPFVRLIGLFLLFSVPVLVSAQVDDDEDEDSDDSRIQMKPITDDPVEEDDGPDFFYDHRFEVGFHISPHLRGEPESLERWTQIYYGPTLDWVFLNAPFKISTGVNSLKGLLKPYWEDPHHSYSQDRDTHYYYMMQVNYTQIPLVVYLNLSDEKSPRFNIGLGVTMNYLNSVYRTEMFDLGGGNSSPTSEYVKYGRMDIFNKDLTGSGFDRISYGLFAGCAIDAEIARKFTLGVQPYISYVYMPNESYSSDMTYEMGFAGIQFRLAYNLLSAFQK